MHIIVLENDPSSFRGGQERSLLDVCQGLHNRGHIISLLYRSEGDLLDKYQQFCVELVKVNNYRIDRHNFLYSLRFFFLDNIQVKADKNSLVYSNQYHDSFFAYTLALSKNIPFVCHLRLPPPPLKTFGLQRSIGMHGTKRLIAVSRQTKMDWVNQGFDKNKIDVVYNGINTQEFKPSQEVSLVKKKCSISQDIKIICYVGRIDKQKGLETLIRGLFFLKKYGINANLMIAGKPLLQDENYQKSLFNLSIELGLEKSVNFLGHVTIPTSIYQVSDVSVLPCFWSEPCPRSIIESMACGTPAIASRIGGIPEILTGEFQSMLFEPGDAQSLADTLNRFLKWKDLDPQLGLRCREHVLHNFNLDRMVDSVEKVFLKISELPCK
ncbi:MAG: glycosyltransferase family 4 protein [Stigonema ocellatum SAG 48.90 = DSM 106950]|nr:glycosyltransferase family 4 protein [Stigonema ocellatum SAG 48.90 = DSM 106950]